MANVTTPDSATGTKQRLDILSNELNVLHSLENWATSLFLGAIGLISKQIIDWSNPVQIINLSNSATAASCEAIALHWQIFLLPAAIGLVAFVYLRSLNFRIRDVRARLYALAPDKKDVNWTSFGLVGWSMALMPLAFGYAVSWYLGIDNQDPEVMDIFRYMGWLGIISIEVALVVFICQGKCCCQGRCCNECSKL